MRRQSEAIRFDQNAEPGRANRPSRATPGLARPGDRDIFLPCPRHARWRSDVFNKQHTFSPSPDSVGLDVHSHLVPEVDDGVEDVEEAAECIRGLREFGYRGAVVTPHIRPGMFDNDEAALAAAFERLRGSLGEALGGFELRLAAEYWFDERLLERIEEEPDRLLGFGSGGRLLLVEFSTLGEPVGVERLFEACRHHGLRPVIAHVERYRGLAGSAPGRERLQRWRENGILLQISVGSFVERGDRQRRTIARQLLKRGMVDLLGTDLHRQAELGTIDAGWRWLRRRRRIAFDPVQQEGLLGGSPDFRSNK